MNYRILVERSLAEMNMPGEAPQENHDIAQQTLVESGMVKHLTDALRSSVTWKVQGDPARKLATLRFIFQSFHRHLEHLMALEENDGYMDLVEENSPQLSKTVASLRQQHEALRSELRRLAVQVEHVCATDLAAFHQLCLDLLDFLRRLDEHSSQEVGVLQEAFERDGGGEG